MKQAPRPRLPIITLLTDFGLQDEYVAVIKGVILSLCRTAQIVDLSHLIPPQAVATAMHLLQRSFRHFPKDTVHLAVVDPEVGSERAILGIAAFGQFFIGPDNGLFTPLLTEEGKAQVYRLDSPSLHPRRVSTTFHGRDIMAPAAAKIARGTPLARLGTRISIAQCRKLESTVPQRFGNRLIGEIIHADRFGNLCSNLQRRDLLALGPLEDLRVTIGERQLPLVATYATAPPQAIVALLDSNDFLEIACNCGDSAHQLGVAPGTPITIVNTSKQASNH